MDAVVVATTTWQVRGIITADAHELRQVVLLVQLSHHNHQTVELHCKKYPYIHIYFVASFPHFNGISSVYICIRKLME